MTNAKLNWKHTGAGRMWDVNHAAPLPDKPRGRYALARRLVLFAVAVSFVTSVQICAAQDKANSGGLAARFHSVAPLIDRRVEIGTVSPVVKSVWSRLASEAESSGKLLSPHGFADFIIRNEIQLKGDDYGQLQGLYLSLQRPPQEWTEIVDSHVASGNAVLPVRYEFEVAFNRYPSTMHVRSFHDGKHCAVSTTATTVSFDGTAVSTAVECAIVATDGKRSMSFGREGYRCQDPIKAPKEIWKADVTPFQGYRTAIRKDDPFLLYYPDAYRSAYELQSTVEPLGNLRTPDIWETTGRIDGRTVFFRGSPVTYWAFDTETGDLLLYSTGEYKLVGGSIQPGGRDRQSRVRFRSHELFDSLGRLPTKTSLIVGSDRTTVHLLSAAKASPANDTLVEETIPENAYVLDRINGFRYVKQGKENSASQDGGQ